MKTSIVISIFGMLFLASAHAQELKAGSYSGTYTVSTTRGPRNTGITLDITSVDNGKLKGTAVRMGRHCRGEYQVEGVYEGNNIQLSSKKGGPAGDCSVNLTLTVEGDKLTGKMGSLPVVLSK